MTAREPLARRDFFRALGAGIAIFVCLEPPRAAAQTPRFAYPEDFNAYLGIAADGRVSVFSGKIEMGQGVLTSQAQMVAEELGLPLSSIDMVLGDTDRCPPDLGTFGSLTTRQFGPALRAAAARARAALLDLGAQRLQVEAGRLELRDGAVRVAADPRRQVSFGELAGGARITGVVDAAAVQRAVPHAPDHVTMIGTSPPRLDGVEKVTGAARYTADLRLPGMLYARLLRPPVHGARRTRLDTAAAARLPGVTLVEQADLVAVLHEDPQRAEQALQALDADWELPAAGVDAEGIFDALLQRADGEHELAHRGDLAAAGAGLRHFEQRYEKGYVAHAAMEPHAALARVAEGRAEIWASTQTPFPTRDHVAAALGLEPSRVRVRVPYVGGGFGGKSADRQAVEAARLAQRTGRPVLVAWSRAEEFFLDTFDPAGVVTIASDLGADGRIARWDSRVVASGERGAIPPYAIPALRVRSAGGIVYGGSAAAPAVHPFGVGPWRAPGANMNVFAIESQIDLMAAAAGVDPLEFRLRHLEEPRLRRVLQAAAQAFGWTPGTGRGQGIACSVDAGTCVAACAQIEVDAASGALRVLRVVCAQDMGQIINPEGARMQIEGGITMGLGYALSEELHFQGGDIADRNFDTYAIPRFAGVPRIETLLLPNDAIGPQGGGEPPITVVGAVLANALADATGRRLTRLPMTPQRVRAALAHKSPE